MGCECWFLTEGWASDTWSSRRNQLKHWKLRAASGDLDARNFAMRPERKGLGAGDSGLWRGIRVVALLGMRYFRVQNNAARVEGDGS